MKFLHFHIACTIIESLKSILLDGYHADKVIERTFKNHKKWGARDRKIVAESIYEIVRWKRLLSECTGNLDLWKIFGAYLILNFDEIPDWKEFNGVNPNLIKEKYLKFQKIRKIRESIPDWLDELGEKELYGRWDSLISALNKKAQVFLRANTLKNTAQELQATLFNEKIKTELINCDGLVLTERANVFQTNAFKSGLFEVQDAASQMVSPFLEPEPGMRIVDACAGSGGKALHLASLMKNKGKIIALDIFEWKLDELKKRAKRAGIDIIETRVIESNKVIKRLYGKADRLLLDVPCSGLGVLRRNPDTKWKLSIEELEETQKIQADILQNYSHILKPNALMVYSTCSILPSENGLQIKTFLENNKTKWQIVSEKNLYPDTDGFDGFYMARLKS
ncbi:MAG: methyltransferase domain-containing protein [Desulfobacterales bacterium]|nr:methyltransferase domain-containing protein [Desulfobacterales bacterium]